MKIIIGLGNPGKEYESTRHNAGYSAIDRLEQELGCSPREEAKMSALISDTMIAGEKILFVKPLTFMNESGTCVRALFDFYKLSPSDIILLHDDLDISLGTYRPTASSRAAGHNGVQDVIDKIGTQDIFRIRLGIGRPEATDGVCISFHDYVLQKFPKEELEKLVAIFPKVKEEIISFLMK